MHDVQAVIEIAGDHRQARAGLLVEGPESEVIAGKVVEERSDSSVEQIACAGILRGEPVIVDSPECPDKSVEDVRGRGDEVLLEPEVSGFVGEGYASFGDRALEADEGLAGLVQIFGIAGFLVSANQQ